MSDPYRDPEIPCPACNRAVREFNGRLVCDSCDGMFLALPDLAHAICELTGAVPEFSYREEKAGTRACPRCRAPMSTCKLELVIETEHVKPKPVLDRCAEHGVWFDGEELAGVFQKVIGKGPGGGGVDRKPMRIGGYDRPSMASGGWRGWSGVPEWWGGGGGGKW